MSIPEHKNYPNFTKNKYFSWYCKIIDNALKRNLVYDSSMHEKHHCLPESLGGKEIVILTYREHYICHELLVRFTKDMDKMKMCFALHTFFHFDYHRPIVKRSFLYESHKKQFIASCKERIPATNKQIFIFKNMITNETFQGTRNDFKHISGISDQEIYNLIRNNSKNIRWNSKKWGIYNEKYQCFSFDIPRKSVTFKKIACEHCGKLSSGGNYNRWHGKNCVVVNPTKHEKNVAQIKSLNKKLSPG